MSGIRERQKYFHFDHSPNTRLYQSEMLWDFHNLDIADQHFSLARSHLMVSLLLPVNHKRGLILTQVCACEPSFSVTWTINDHFAYLL